MPMHEVAPKEKIKPKMNLKEPSMFNVVYVNDEVTTVDFVIASLVSVFDYSKEAAQLITNKVHEEGFAVVATLPYELAEQKGVEATVMARNAGFPLLIKLESAT